MYGPVIIGTVDGVIVAEVIVELEVNVELEGVEELFGVVDSPLF